MIHYTSHSQGFTLIETLIYLALYAIIILGALCAFYSIFESSARNQTIALIEEEGSYLTAKIDWILGRSVSVILPAVRGSRLETLDSNGNHMSVWSAASHLTEQLNNGSADVLSNSNVSIVGLAFVDTIISNDAFNPESVTASFTLLATTSDGHVLSRTFTISRYIHS